MPPISCQRLVGTVARQRDRNLLARHFAHAVSWQRRCIGKRFVKVERKRIHQRIIIGGDFAASMVSGEALGDQFGICGFVEFADVEANRAGLDGLPRGFGHQGNDAAAVYPAGEERPQRHIGDHPRDHALAHKAEQFLFEFGLTAFCTFGKIDVPIFDWLR